MDDKECDTNRDRGVANVEDGPDAQVDEVDHVAKPEPVDQIPRRASQHQGVAPPHARGCRGPRDELPHQPTDDEQRQADEERLLMFEEAERRAGILDVGEMQDRRQKREALSGSEGRGHEIFRELISDQRKAADQPRPSSGCGGG